jgi:hypothetical protein
MEVLLFTIYVLMWPLASAGVLVVIVVAFIREALQVKREGRARELV